MPLNYQERRIYHWHAELDRRIGQDRLAPDLCVPDVLQAHVDGWTAARGSVRPADRQIRGLAALLPDPVTRPE